MAAGRRPPRHNRLTRRRDAEKTRQSNPQPTGDPQKTDPIRANRARDALVLTTVTAQSLSGRERPSPSYEKTGLERSPSPARRWPKSLAIFKKALDFSIANSGRKLRPFTDGPEVLAIERETVRAEFLKSYPAENAKAKGVAFGRCVNDAIATGLMNSRELGAPECASTFFWSLRS